MRKTHNIQAFCPHGGHTGAHGCHQFYECLHSKKQRPEKFRAPRAAFYFVMLSTQSARICTAPSMEKAAMFIDMS